MNRIFLALSFFLFSISALRAQCSGFPATLAQSDCGTGTPLSSGANINSGTYSFCGASSATTTFTGLNLAGGTITICGNVNLSGNWNSGSIIVACGATANFPSGLVMNSNIKIVNYGRVNVTGNLEFQNSDNCFYNESTTARLYVTGNLIFPQNNGQNAYLKNNGYISVGGTFDARSGGFSCFGTNGQMETVNINYGTNCGAPANRFTYNGSTGNGIIRYTGAANIRANFTSTTFYAINKGSAATQNLTCGSWGSATVATNSPAITVPSPPTCPATTPNCFAALPVELTGFEAIAAGSRVDAYWSTESEHNNAFFLLQRAADAETWETVAEIPGAGSSSVKHDYLQSDHDPLRGLSYYRLVQTDFDGTQTFSDIRSVVVQPETSFVLYPNPAETSVNLLPAPGVRFERLFLTDAAGRTVLEQEIVSEGLQTVATGDLPRGSYLVTAQLSNGFAEQRLLILR